MKKEIFIYVGIITLIIGTVFLNIKKSVVKDITIKKDNIEVIYPYFNVKELDNTLSNYITSSLKELTKNESIFIDYDYSVHQNSINVNLYKSLNYNTVLEVFEYDRNDKTIKKSEISSISNNNIFHQKNVINKNKKMVAFTFDDGPNYNTKKLIDVLNKHRVHASFFVVGSNVKSHTRIIKYMKESGMDIGNHTYNHKELTKYKKNIIKNEIELTNDAIYEVTSSYPKFLRPPYGSINKKVKEVSNNMPMIIWNLDTLDWKCHNSEYIVRKILNNIDDGDIILMHSIYSATINAVDIVIPKLRDLGYEVVSVSELFYYKDKTYQNGSVYSYVR